MEKSENQTLHNFTRKREMLKALEKHYGIVTYACKDVDISRVTHYNWLDEDAEYRKAVEELDNVALDHSESKLRELIEGVMVEKIDEDGGVNVYKKEPNSTAVIFHLKTRGKKRGYVERIENEQVGDQKIVIHETIITSDEYNKRRLSAGNIFDESEESNSQEGA